MIRTLARGLPPLVLLVAATGCAGTIPEAEGVPPLGESAAVAPGVSSFDPHARIPLFHSKRFELDLPLPDGRAWRINDHTEAALVATHEATRSKVTLLRFPIEELANRQKCEKLALALHVLPGAPLVAVEDVNETTQESYDTHIVVGLEQSEPGGPVVGHVIAVGGAIHKCYAFDFRSEVSSSELAEQLSDRLAFARTRILGGIHMQRFGEPPLPKPTQTKLPR